MIDQQDDGVTCLRFYIHKRSWSRIRFLFCLHGWRLSPVAEGPCGQACLHSSFEGAAHGGLESPLKTHKVTQGNTTVTQGFSTSALLTFWAI